MTILHLHLARQKHAEPREFESIDADVAARLSSADCHAIGGYPDKNIRAEDEMMRATSWLLRAFLTGLFIAIAAICIAIIPWP